MGAMKLLRRLWSRMRGLKDWDDDSTLPAMQHGYENAPCLSMKEFIRAVGPGPFREKG